jgi:hypothetical protein
MANLGDFWFCYADRDLYEYNPNPITFQTMWNIVGAGRYVSTNPPPVQTSTSPPIDPIWIKANDPNRVPRIFDPSGNWIPIVQASFVFPPQNPNVADIWSDTNTQSDYTYDGTNWIKMPSQTLQINLLPTPAPLFMITAPGNIKPSALKIAGLIEIYMDGTIIYDPSYTPDKAAKALWEAIAYFSPTYKEGQEVKELRTLLELARNMGFKIPQPRKPGDPNAAWDAAMGVII